MKLRDFGIAAALAVGFIMPAGAQIFSTNPTTPNSSSIGVHQAKVTAARDSHADLVDINTASPAALDALPGIGKVRAEAIVRNRPYRGKDDLVSRHIIPPNVYNSIKNRIIARQG